MSLQLPGHFKLYTPKTKVSLQLPGHFAVKRMYKVLNDLAPSSLTTLFVRKRNITEYDLRGSSTSLQLPFPKTENLKKCFCYDGAKLWNSLPADMRDSDTLPTFINAIDAYNL